ncbi:MAG: hypothetical protein K2N49_00255 [Ruminococcus sp.]|nr:hypothetical protein [Ruminococcus sp.]
MKKFISAVASTAVLASVINLPAIYAESYGNGTKITVLGDGVSLGSGLSAGEYDYGTLVARYLKGSVENYAVKGSRAHNVLEQIQNFSDKQKAQIADSDVVVIAVGSHDMTEYVCDYMLNMFASINCLKDWYDVNDIPEKPSFSDINLMTDRNKLSTYIENPLNAVNITTNLQVMRLNLTATTKTQNYSKYKRIFELETMPAIKSIAEELKAINPDVRIIFQDIYNPLEFEPSYFNENFTGGYKSVMVSLRTNFKLITQSFSEQLKAIDGIEVADVRDDFMSYEMDDYFNEYYYSWYFTNIQSGGGALKDIYPNQAGNVAIATAVLNTIGEIHDEGSLLERTFMRLPDMESYPAYALEKYNRIAGEYISYPMGDVDDNLKVDASDATMILVEYGLLSTGKDSMFSEEQRNAGDIDGDGKVDSTDASKVLEYYAYLSTGGQLTRMKDWLEQR